MEGDAQRERFAGTLALSAAALFWSGNFVAGRALGGHVDPVTLNATRWTITALLLAPFAVRALWQARAVLRRSAGLVAGLCVTGVICFQVFVYEALSQIPVVNAVLMLATMPVVILAMSAVLRRKPVPLAGWGAVALSGLGVAVLLTDGRLAELAAARLSVGDLWMLAAVLAWAIYTLLLRKRPAELKGNVLLLATVLPALPVLIGGAVLTGSTNFADLGPTQWSFVLYVSVFPSLLAFLCWNYGVSKIGPEASGFYINLMPVFATILAWLLLGEGVSVAQGIGALLIVAGIGLSRRVSL